MKKKLGIVIGVIILICGGVYLVQKGENNLQTKEEAIKQAQAYQPEGACTQALVPAVHKATGAEYTFSSGCLAPGWEPESNKLPTDLYKEFRCDRKTKEALSTDKYCNDYELYKKDHATGII